MNNKTYKTIFFDWNKTLSNSLFWNQLANKNHERHDWHKKIVDFIFIKNKHLINDWMKAKINEEDIASLISKEFKYPKQIILEDLAESCRDMQFVSDEVLNLIKKIRDKGIKCVIATDNMETFTKYTKPALELEKHFDDCINSFDKKVLKFDFEENNKIPFFDDYLKTKNLNYSDVVLVDDCIDEKGVYNKLGFDILQVFDSEDFLEKLKKLAE